MDIERDSEEALQQATATVGPISVAIDASKTSFRFYKNGVYNEPMCSSTQLDHGVTVVGYGTEGAQDYWIVKNRYVGWNMTDVTMGITAVYFYLDKHSDD